MRKYIAVALFVVLQSATPVHAGRINYGGNGYGQGGDADSTSSAQSTSVATSNVNVIFEAPPPPPIPMETGMDCWHGYDVPSYDNPGVVKHVRIWQCEPK